MKDGEIKHKLSPAQVSVMQHRVTEPPYFGKFWDHFEAGRYRCAACDTALFASEDKIDSKTGWPSFKKPLSERDLQFKGEPGPDDKVEIRCKKCKSHLGYVIAGDAPYYRINSVCLLFEASAKPTTPVPSEVLPPPPKVIEPALEIPAEIPSRGLGSLIAGILIGTLLGGAGTAYYMNMQTTPVPEAATTTAEVATSTVEVRSENTEAPVVSPRQQIIQEEEPLNDIPPQNDTETSTSTQ